MKKFKLLLVSLVLMAFGATGVYAEDYAATHTSNVTFTLGNKSYKEKMNIAGTQYDVIKLGTSSVVGTASFKIPAGTAKIHMHVIGWKGKSSQVNLTAGNGVTLGTTAITPKSDDGATNNSPYTLKGDATTYYYEITTTGVEQETTITMTTVSGKTRVIVWGVNTEVATVVDPETPEYTITANVNDPAMGIVSGAGKYYEGTVASLNAIPNAGYKFVNWSNGSTDNPLKITVTEDVEITANFEAIPPMTCAEAAAAPEGATIVLNPFDVVAVVKGAGYIYIKDESGVALIYDFTMDDQLKAGDHVEGFVGTSSPYNNLPEIKPTVAFADLKVTPGTAPEPTLFTAAPTKADVNKYVKFENVTLTANATFTTSSATNATMVVNGTNVTLRNTFKLAATLSKDKAYNIVGFAAIYNSTIQVYFLSAEEYVAPEPCTLATPVNWDAPITAEANTDQWYAVNVASAIAAGKDLALTVTNPGTEAVEITMEAYADCPATERIVKLTKTFNAGETKTTTVKYDEYLADQVEVVYMHVTTKGGEIKVEAQPEIEWMEMPLEITNLTTEVMEIEGAKYLMMMGGNEEMGESVNIFLNNYADVDDDYEVNAESSLIVYMGYEFTVLEGTITQTSETEKGTLYTGTIYAYTEIEGEAMYVKFDLTMYATPATVLVLTDAIVAINEELGTLTFNVPTGEGEGYYAELAGYTAPGVHEGPQICLFETPEAVAFANYVETSVADGVITLTGEFTSFMGAKFDVTISGKLPVVEPEPTTETVYFINTKKWANVTAHAWGAKLPDTAWPGLATVKEAEQIAGYDVYSFTANVGDYANVIFNNKGGGSQTPDLVWTAGKYYVIDMDWLTKEEAEAKLAAPLPETWNIVGDAGLMGKGWDLNAAENAMTLQADGTYLLEKKDITITAGTYEYKAAKDHGWTVAVPQDGNQKLTISKSGIYDITFVLNVTAKTLKATATLKKEAVVIPTIVIAGDMNSWNQTKDKFTMAADSLTATFKATLTAKSYGFKMIVGGAWHSDGKTITRAANSTKFTGANGENSKLTADIAGEYLFTWEYATKTLTVTYPALPVKYNVTVTAENGTVTGAGEYEEGKTATLTATPAEGYEFVNWTVGEEVVSTENPYSFVVTADVALVANFQEAAPEYDVMDITMTNLVVEEMEGFLVLTASDDDNTGLNVMLALNADGSINTEVSYMALLQGWNETELPIVEGAITKAYNEELATDVYTGLVVVEYMEGKLGLNLTMYAKPVVVTDVVVTDATITVETGDDGMGGTYEMINVTANWNESVLTLEGVEKEFEGFLQITETFVVDGEEDWYIWMCMNGVITTVDNVLTVTGEFKNNFTGDVYNVTISGTLPVEEEPEVPTGLDNLDTTVAPAKLIENGQLIIIKNGVRYNATGAIVK